MSKVKISKKELRSFLAQVPESKREEVGKLFESWIGGDAMPAKSMKPPLELDEPVVVSPASETQVSDTDLPLGDNEWAPGNRKELAMAMKQLAQYVPEGQIGWFWPRLKRLVDKTNDNVDQTRALYSAPRTADTSKI